MRTIIDVAPAIGAGNAATRTIGTSHTVNIDADVLVTIATLRRVDLAAPALRAVEAMGLADRVTPHRGGVSLWPDVDCGPIEVGFDLDVIDTEAGSRLTISMRAEAADERARVAMMRSWPVLGPLAEHLLARAARTVKEISEHDAY